MEMAEKAGAGKKRASSVDRDHDKDEEIMVERFFQLVASFREARNRLIRKETKIFTTRGDDDDDDRSKKKEMKRKRTTSSSSSVEEIGNNRWRGEFEREDFFSEAEPFKVPSPTTIIEITKREDATKRQHGNIKRHRDHVAGCLNLDLSL